MQNQYDLIIIGGGSGGVGAAIAAAREGVKTLLVEAHPWLGGTSTLGGVNCWEMGAGGSGIPFELYRRLKERPGAAGVYSIGRHFGWQPDGWHWPHALEKVNFPGGENLIDPDARYLDTLRRHNGSCDRNTEAFCREAWHGIPFEPEALHSVMMATLKETGKCDILLNTRLESVRHSGGWVESITLSGNNTFTAPFFIDSSGNGTLCAMAGCEQLMGIDPKSRFQEPGAPEEGCDQVNAATLIFRVTPTATPKIEPLPDGIPAAIWWRVGPAVSCINQYPNGDRNINMLPSMEGAEYMRLGEEAARAECLRRVRCHWHFLQSHFPEFQKYRICWIAPMMGVRETYRTVCEKMLTENDINAGLSGQRDNDIITIADHALDRHGEKGGCPEVREPYGVPYRSLIPKGMTNLLIACRGAGFSSIAASSCRLTRTMMALGQAAGSAVALARESGTPLPEVNGSKLRDLLRRQHVQLEYPLTKELREYLMQGE